MPSLTLIPAGLWNVGWLVVREKLLWDGWSNLELQALSTSIATLKQLLDVGVTEYAVAKGNSEMVQNRYRCEPRLVHGHMLLFFGWAGEAHVTVDNHC